MSVVGVVGLGVMGSQLSLNFAEKLKKPVSGFDLDPEKGTKTESAAEAQGKLPVRSFSNLAEFVASLEMPRRVVLLVPAGKPVEAAIESLLPLLTKGDVLADLGNEWYELTEARAARIAPTGVHFMGCGLSGGSEGARNGPCLMPGGSKDGWALMRPLLESIAARAGSSPDAADSFPCVRYVGPGGSGHYVKMVHNGIEYGDMQLIAEAAFFCREAAALSASEVGKLMRELNGGLLSSFLMETTATLHMRGDAEHGAPLTPLVDVVVDACGSKGTGKWTVQQAAELGVPCATHAAALEARYLSSLVEERTAMADAIAAADAAAESDNADTDISADEPSDGPAVKRAKHEATTEDASATATTPAVPLTASWRSDLEDALVASKLCSYAQGMAHLRAVSEANGWGLCMGDFPAIWQNGCIIRAKVLTMVAAAYERDPHLSNLLLDREIAAEMRARLPGWRRFVLLAMGRAIPVPALAASLTYFDGLQTRLLRSAQCIQAQRDCFGGHGFKRLDAAGTFSVDWTVTS